MRYWNGWLWTDHVRALRAEERIDGVLLGDVVGSGATAEVRLGRQPTLDRNVAVKIIASDLDDAAKKRFQREQMAMGRLSGHPGIVPVYQAGLTSADRPYIVMPHLQGSIASEVIANGPIPPGDAAALMAKVCDAVAFAHEHGVLHRDVKPGNIMRSPNGDPMLTDFGIAAFASDDEPAGADSALTPLYAPPEVLAGHGATGAADVYSLGATLYTIVAGVPAFADGDSGLEAVRARVLNEPVSRPAVPIPDALWAAIASAMSKDPGERPGPAELATTLRAAATTSPSADHPAGTAPDSPAIGQDVTRDLLGERRALDGPRRLTGVLVAILVIVLIIVAMVLLADGSASLPPG